MPDTEISRLTELPSADIHADDVLAIVDDSAREAKKVKAFGLVTQGISQLPEDSISVDKIDWAGGQPDVIDGSALVDGSVSGSKLQANTIGAREIAPNAIEASELADGAVDTAAIASNAVTAEKIETGALLSRHYSSGSVNQAALATDSVGADELQDNAVDTAAVEDEAITAAKLSPDLNGDAVLAAGSVNSALADNSVSAAKLQDDAVNTNKIASGAVTDTKISDVSGSKLVDSSVPVGKLEAIGFSHGIELDGTVKHTNSIAAGNRNGIVFDAQGHVTATTELVSSDLPIATETQVGGISVPPESGLTVSNGGVIDHADTIAPGTAAGITFNSHGHVTDTRPLEGGDLPVATSSSHGAVLVPGDAANAVTIDGDGHLRHKPANVAEGTYVSVTVDANGHVQGGSTTLNVNQIPSLSADQITSGEIGTDRIEDDSVTAKKLADYATCLMQEDNPGKGDFLGQLWFTPSTAQLRVYARGSGNQNLWVPVGFGNLQQNNLRWLGTYDATADAIVSLTAIGTSEGLTAGDAFPAPTAALSGGYFICAVAGNACTQPDLDGANHTTGDWALCLGETQGWQHIDINGGGGGGGGPTYLDDLMDVKIGGTAGPFSTQPRMDLSSQQILKYDGGSGMWRNTDMLDGGSF